MDTLQLPRHVTPAIAELAAFHPESKLWIFVANRPLNEIEIGHATTALRQFTTNWTSHDQQMKATFEIFENQVLIVMADETQAHAGGCSQDKLNRFVEQTGAMLKVDFFDRMRFLWMDGEQVRQGDRDEAARLRRDGQITDDTPMFNALAKTRFDLQKSAWIPLKESWHQRLI